MAITTVVVNDALVGTIIGPPDGYITRIVMTKGQEPAWQQENFIATPFPDGRWLNGRFVLRDQGGAGRRVISFATQYGVLFADRTLMTSGQSFRFSGGLLLECLPVGQEWEVDFSDVPVVRAAA